MKALLLVILAFSLSSCCYYNHEKTTKIVPFSQVERGELTIAKFSYKMKLEVTTGFFKGCKGQALNNFIDRTENYGVQNFYIINANCSGKNIPNLTVAEVWLKESK